MKYHPIPARAGGPAAAWGDRLNRYRNRPADHLELPVQDLPSSEQNYGGRRRYRRGRPLVSGR